MGSLAHVQILLDPIKVEARREETRYRTEERGKKIREPREEENRTIMSGIAPASMKYEGNAGF